MASNSEYFLNKTLGEDFFESLVKVELWKPGTRTTIDHEEIKTSLQIVPKVLMSFIIKHLSSMQIGENKEVQLPVKADNALLKVSKHERDVFSGQVLDDNKIVTEFKYRSIPGVALVIMSAFELYSIDNLTEDVENQNSSENLKLQKLIDERLALHDLIDRVVEKKLEQKDAIKQLLLERLTEQLQKDRSDISNMTKIMMDDPASKKEEYFRGMANGLEVVNSVVNDKEPQFLEAPKPKKESPLKNFLDKKKQKTKPTEFKIEMMKGETVDCPDCGKNIFDGEGIQTCICYGDSGKIFLKKTETGIKIRFGKNWDIENIQMLLDALRRKND